MGIAKRKLTRKEASKITKEVMATGLNPEDRFQLAIIKAIDCVNSKTKEKRR